MKVAFHTLGCKVNTFETEAVWADFERAGYERVAFDETADVYVINTCTVTNQGDAKSRKYIRKAIRQNEHAVVAVMGCYAQISAEEIAQIEGVDVVIGNADKAKVYDLVQVFLRQRQQIKHVDNIFHVREFEKLEAKGFENTRAFLKIQDGCNQFCSYCIIPFARGRMRSRDPEGVIKQVREIVLAGYQEIVLTGIHTGGYGEDIQGYTFSMLLRDILTQVKDLKRLRISSLEINQVDALMLQLLRESSVIAKHLHLPLQSGSDTILQAMRRQYLTSDYAAKVAEIRAILPDIAITTDVIVGFPAETDALFEETKAFIQKIGFSQLHVFPYSKRNGTKAAMMKDQVKDIDKTIRVNELMKLSEALHQSYAKQFIGKILAWIPEMQLADERYVGHTENFLKVIVKAKDVSLGEMLPVTIQMVENNEIIGLIG